MIPRAEYDRAAAEAVDSDTPTMFVRLFTDRVQPLLDAGVADLVDDVHPVTSEITMRPAAGHTPGQMRVDVHSGDELAILCADVVHFPFEITHPEIASDVSDLDPALAVAHARSAARRVRRPGRPAGDDAPARPGGRPGPPRRGAVHVRSRLAAALT